MRFLYLYIILLLNSCSIKKQGIKNIFSKNIENNESIPADISINTFLSKKDSIVHNNIDYENPIIVFVIILILTLIIPITHKIFNKIKNMFK